MNVEPLAVQKIGDIQEQRGVPWLVEGLWLRQGVGFLCGSPKACKTWLALDVALSVASRTAVLGEYPVAEAGAVLLFVAEDPPAAVRSRLAGMACPRGVSLDELPIHLVMHRSLRLESPRDQARLRATVARYRPTLLVLDPFVRLTAIDENSSLEVSGVLASLRELQATLGVAI
ncbi:MAG: AAA family ATPase, partial [Candidatus Rokuibacteriota bacterium]